jgi:hypothetical protein
MTARPRAARTIVDASEFDIDGWVGKFMAPNVKVALYKRADLMPRLVELQKAVEKAKPVEGAEQSFAEGGDWPALVEEHNRLAQELDDSAEWFEFGPSSKPLIDAGHEKATADGVPTDDGETRGVYVMAECLVTPKVPGAALVQLRRKLGDAVFMTLFTGWQDAVNFSANVGADFLPMPSPTPGTGE